MAKNAMVHTVFSWMPSLRERGRGLPRPRAIRTHHQPIFFPMLIQTQPDSTQPNPTHIKRFYMYACILETNKQTNKKREKLKRTRSCAAS